MHNVLAAILIVGAVTPIADKQMPYSCQQLLEAERKCAANTIGPCYVQKEVDRLRKECLRDGGRPS